MKFVDEAIITVRSGDGGRGCVSFRREKFIPRGGPDGGDGGKGGDVILKTVLGKRTLYEFRHRKFLKAKNGAHGRGKQKTGKKGDDIVIDIPPGTLVYNAQTGKLLKDFTKPDEQFLLVKGGRGGQGNTRFKTSKKQAPRFAQDGEQGEALTIKLELKLIADVGIIGLPNAGKSTLISAISSAHPKIGNYPFTTLTPCLGVVYTDFGEPFVVADIPGLIKDASKGAGLGISFLKHIERTRVLIHLIDASAVDQKNPLCAYNTICNELNMHSESLGKKPQIVVLNKIDLPGAKDMARIFQKEAARAAFEIKGKNVLSISAVTRDGIDGLISTVVRMI